MNFDGDFDGDHHNNNYDEIEVEHIGTSNTNNNNQGFDDFFGNNQTNAEYAAVDWNIPVAVVDSSLNEQVVKMNIKFRTRKKQKPWLTEKKKKRKEEAE